MHHISYTEQVPDVDVTQARNKLSLEGNAVWLATLLGAYLCKKLLPQTVTIDAAVDSEGRAS
jgi:hypothetical protein